MNGVFYFIVNMSLASCFVIAALHAIRLIRPLRKRIVYPLWALAFFRLVLPFSLSAGWSLYNFTGGLVKRLVTVQTITQGSLPVPGPGKFAFMNMLGAAERYAPVTYKTDSLRQVFTFGAALWAIGAAAALIAVCILYILTWAE
ncbi:MAG: hypothetical protein GX847_07990, partial [Clostridiales bacterium]|nr:hypothetical protein [Clostridiales bacterium]